MRAPILPSHWSRKSTLTPQRVKWFIWMFQISRRIEVIFQTLMSFKIILFCIHNSQKWPLLEVKKKFRFHIFLMKICRFKTKEAAETSTDLTIQLEEVELGLKMAGEVSPRVNLTTCRLLLELQGQLANLSRLNGSRFRHKMGLSETTRRKVFTLKSQGCREIRGRRRTLLMLLVAQELAQGSSQDQTYTEPRVNRALWCSSPTTSSPSYLTSREKASSLKNPTFPRPGRTSWWPKS